MQSVHLRSALIVVSVVAAMTPGGLQGRAAEEPHRQQESRTDWKVVEQALGKSGQMQGEVFRIGLPRTDLKVSVKGVQVKPGFALGSYAAFTQMGDAAMVMGDLVLLDEEVNRVLSGLLQRDLVVTGLHNHVNEVSPHVMYLHFAGRGDAVKMAAALREASRRRGPPSGPDNRPA